MQCLLLSPSVEVVQKVAPRKTTAGELQLFRYILWLFLGSFLAFPLLKAQELELETNRMDATPGFRKAANTAADAHTNQLADPHLAIRTAQRARELLPSAAAYPALYATFDSYEAEAWLNSMSGNDEDAIEASINLAQASNRLLEKVHNSDMLIVHNLITLGNAYLRIPVQDQIANSERAFSIFRRADEMIISLQPIYPKAAFTDCSGPDVLAGLLDAEASRFYVSDTPKRFAMQHFIERLQQFEGKVDQLCSAKSIAAIARVSLFSIESGYASDKLFADTLEQFQHAISLLDPSRQPYLWADAQRDYGRTLYNRDRLITYHDPQHEFAMQQEALDALLLAESVFTKTAAPRQWAITEECIAEVYIWRPTQQNYGAAYLHYLNASEILGKERRFAAVVHQNLADSLFRRSLWSDALKEYQASFQAKRVLSDPNFLERSLQADYEQDYPAYQKAAFSAIKVGEYQQAFTILTNADGRGLSELLSVELTNQSPNARPQVAKLRATLEEIARLDSTFHELRATTDGLTSNDEPITEVDLAKAQRLRNQARSLERTLHLGQLPTLGDVGARSTSAKNQKEPIVVTAVTPRGAVVLMAASSKSLSSRNVVVIEDLTIDSIENLAWSNRNLGLTVIRSPEREIVVVKSAPDQAKAAAAALKGEPGILSQVLDPNEDPGPQRLIPGVAPGDAANETKRAIRETQDQLKPLACAIVLLASRLDVPLGSNIHYVGSGLLTMIPLGAAVSRSDGTSRLDDDFAISFSPNITALLAMQRRTRHSLTERNATVIYDPDLVMGDFQAKSLRVLGYKHVEEEASLGTLLNPTLSARITDLTIAMHGHFERVEPWASRITLAGKSLTVAELNAVRLPAARLVVLSACDTGIKGFDEATTESIGFPEVFLKAGATNVIGTLWRVDDFATGILLARFYGVYLKDGTNPSQALQSAKVWLQNATRTQIASFMKQLSPAGDERLAGALGRFEHEGAPDARPFKDPYYWAAFTITGY